MDNFHGDHRSWKRQEAFNESMGKGAESGLKKSAGGIHRMKSKNKPDKKQDDVIISGRASKDHSDFHLSADNHARI